MNVFKKQLHYWAHMLDEATLEKKLGVENAVNEAITGVDGDTYNKIFGFLKSLTPDSMDKAMLGGRMTLADLIDLYNFQDGPYRTTRKSDLIITAAAEIFPGLRPKLPIYRGCDNKEELYSMMEAGKTLVNHAISFSTDEDFALDFGDYIFIVEENNGAVCVDLQKYVSSFCRACTDFGVGLVYRFARTENKDRLKAFQDSAVEGYLSKEDLANLDSAKLYSRKQAGKNT